MSLTSSVVGGKIKYKIVLLGDQHVGKTSIIDRFINDRFETTYNATIGIDFLVRNIVHGGKTYRLQLWDTAGQERFKSLIPSYLKDSNICILVYDVNLLQSLQNVERWMDLYNQHKEYHAFCIVVGNKNDQKTRQCTSQIVDQMLLKIKDITHYYISAKTGEGVTELFNSVIDLINERINNVKIIEEIDEKVQEDQSAKTTLKDEKVQKVKGGAIKLEEASSHQLLPQKKKKCC